MSVTPTANEQKLLSMLLPLQDPYERLSLITLACLGPGLRPEARADLDLVAGCVSLVWLRRVGDENQLRLEWDAESPLVRGLAGLICMVYQDTEPLDAAAFQSNILMKLGLDQQLSPTRLRGLAFMEIRIRQLAAG